MNKIRQKHINSLSKLDKLGIAISKYASTMYFFIFCCVLVCIPFIFPQTLSFVQFLSSGIIQLIMLPVLAFSGYMASKYDDIRAEHDLQIDEESRKELEEIKVMAKAILDRLDKQNEG